MSKRVAYVLIVGCLLCAQAQGVPDGLVGYWTFNEGGGDTAFDASGNGNDGVLTNAPTWVPGQLGSALQFNGTNSYVAAPHIPLNSQSFTVALWVNPVLYTTQQTIFAQVQSSTANLSLHLRLGGPAGTAPAPGAVRMGFYSNDLSTAGGLIEDNNWYHLAFIYDMDAQQQRIFVNGELVGERASTPFLGASGDTRIGQWNNNEWFRGMLDDVQLYQNALTQIEVQSIMQGLINPNLASDPSPEDGADDVTRDSVLSWTPGEMTGKRNLYMGASVEDIASMTTPTVADLDVNSFDPGRLEFGKTYAWRVDEVNATPDKTVFEGEVWSFTVEPYSIIIPIDVNHVTASSATELNPPQMSINGSGLNGMMHSTEGEAMWLSAAADFSPWLMYEFNKIEKLDQMLVWNSNSPSEGFIGWGIKGVSIEYSTDALDWTVLTETTQLDRAPGLPTYNTPQAIDFGLVQAKYVRLNIQSNWGGLLPQYGVAEVQFYALPVQVRTPHPASGSTNIRPDSVVTWRAGREAAHHTVYVSTDANEMADGLASSVTSMTNSLDLSSLDLQMNQTYYWRVDEVNEAQVPSVWAGPVWSLSTSTSLVVEDFESYSNLSPNRPFQAWLDGYGYSADEYFAVTYGGNGTGAGIGHDIWSPSSPYFDGAIMETASTIQGSSQSLPFYYTNTGGVASKTEHTFAVAQDWTLGGAKTLSIAFRGQTGNTGTLYVKVNNAKVTYPHDPGSIALGAWQAWNIDLAQVNTNLQSITKLELGVEGSNASGMILIDDIRLYPLAGELITPVDPGNSGLVAYYTFEDNANDMSGNGNNGTLNGTPAFGTGIVGHALECDGVDDYMSTDLTASQLGIGGNNPRTISSWVYTNGFGNGAIYDVGARATGEDFSLRTLDSVNNRWRVQYWGGDFDFSYDTAGKWVHFTHVHDGVNTKIYANGMLVVDWEKTINTTDTNPFQIGLYGWPANYFNGLIDEVRVYNRALSASESAWLAGFTQSIDKPF